MHRQPFVASGPLFGQPLFSQSVIVVVLLTFVQPAIVVVTDGDSIFLDGCEHRRLLRPLSEFGCCIVFVGITFIII